MTKEPLPSADVPEKKPSSIRHFVAVASGKGGVGKSTVAVNLAFALANLGLRVGILDADIYGPSLPTLLGLKGKKLILDPQTQKILPVEKFGLKIVSIGFITDEKDAVVWRGPMIHKILQQFHQEVLWGNLDILVLDLPPGTGDAQISLAQILSLSGAVLVTTPQQVAIDDVVRAISMFKKVNVPILGLVENMSVFECPNCHHATPIFSKGGGQKLAEEYQTQFLGAIPIDPKTREASDLGIPLLAESPNSASSKAFYAIAKKLEEQLNQRSF